MSIPSFSSIVEGIEAAEAKPDSASPRQRAYLIVLMFLKNVDDPIVDRVFAVFDRSDLTMKDASEIIDLLVKKPSLSSTASRARRATFGPDQRDLRDKMSGVLSGGEWPEDVKIVRRD